MATPEEYMGNIPILTRPLYGFNYLGSGNYGYHVPPANPLDNAARLHDLEYERFPGRSGPSLSLNEPALANADAALAARAFVRSLTSLNPYERAVAQLTYSIFGPIAGYKYVRQILGI